MFFIKLLLIIILLIYIYHYNNSPKKLEKFSSQKDLFFKEWLLDKDNLIKKYGLDYLENLISPIFSKISKLPEDIKKYPNFSKCVIKKITLRKGDTLFIPAGWWHYVISNDRNIAINYWYLPWHGKLINEENFRKNIPNYDIDIIKHRDITCKNFMNEYLKKSKPFLMTETKINSKAYDLWNNNNYFIEKLKDEKFNFYRFPKSDFWNYKWRNSQDKEFLEGTIKDFFDNCKIDTTNHYYLARNYKMAKFLKDDFELFDFCDELEYAYSNIWINFGFINSPLHYDQFDNFLNQIDGNKEILLISPSNDPYVPKDNYNTP